MISLFACLILASLAAGAPSGQAVPAKVPYGALSGQAVPAKVPSEVPSGQAERLAKLAKHQDDNGDMCECDYYSGGCMITVGAPKGYKCRCRYFFLWSCNGHAIKCGNHETCPENCATYQCCNHGGGDCGAYESIWNDTVISNWSEMTGLRLGGEWLLSHSASTSARNEGRVQSNSNLAHSNASVSSAWSSLPRMTVLLMLSQGVELRSSVIIEIIPREWSSSFKVISIRLHIASKTSAMMPDDYKNIQYM